jgi:hypothetical protein
MADSRIVAGNIQDESETSVVPDMLKNKKR